MARIFEDGEAARLEPRDQAIFDFAAKLSRTPSEATAEDMQCLRDVGLSEAEILDLVLVTALFGWANRLIHVLGDPVTPAADG
jgi:uncharacterized peroxidase-related enzyme